MNVRRLAALLLALGWAGGDAPGARAADAAAVAAVPAYRVAAAIDPQGMLHADVSIVVPAAMAVGEKAFLLGQRFTLDTLEAGPDTTVAIAPSDVPVPDLRKLTFRFAPERKTPVTLHFRYHGPLAPGDDDGIPPFTPDGIELLIDDMWIPFGADIQTRFTADATIDGIPDGWVVVAQGKVTRTAAGVHIVRETADIDLPMVAAPGLKRAGAPGVEFYARNPDLPLAKVYLRHARAAAAYLQDWFGPLAQPIRMVMVVRKRAVGYARAGYIVVSESERPVSEAGGDDLALIEASAARHVAHEFAHAWWFSAGPLTDDFWLVESMAEYVALRYVDARLDPALAAKLFDVKRGPSATAGPVMGHGRPDKVQLYQKGPLLLLDLEHRIGRPAMDRLLAAFAPQTPHTTAKFLAALSKVAGEGVAHDFDAALHAPQNGAIGR